MTYSDWYSKQSTERQKLSDQLLSLSRLDGAAQHAGDWGASKEYRAAIRELYKKANEMDASQ